MSMGLPPGNWLAAQRADLTLFVAECLGYNQYWLGGFMVFVFFCPGAP